MLIPLIHYILVKTVTEQLLQDDIAELESKVADRKQQNANYRQQIEHNDNEIREFQEAIAELREWLSGAGKNGRAQSARLVPPPTEPDDPTPKRGGVSTPPGLPDGVTRRTVVREIVPEFDGESFEVGDIRKKYLERYPGADTPTLTQALSNILQRMAEKGEMIKRLARTGDGSKEPWRYRELQDQEGRLIE